MKQRIAFFRGQAWGAWVCGVVLLLPAMGSFADSSVRVFSPKETVQVVVNVDGLGKLNWSVEREGKVVISPSPLGLSVEGRNLGEVVKLGKPQRHVINETYSIYGNHSSAVNHCTEMAVPVVSGGIKYVLDVRAYEDGAAVRYRIKMDDKEHRIVGETTGFALPLNAKVWWEHYDQSYEKPCESGLLSGIPENTPLSPPITFGLGDDLYVSLTEANNDCFPDMGLVRHGNRLQACFPASSNGWQHEGSITTPWRAAIIAEGLTALVNSDLITSLCPPPSKELANADWIQPGRSLWQWWAIGAPRYEDQRDWVDAAKTLKFEYYLIDDGWRNWSAPGKDQWECLEEVIDYAKKQGVKALVWVNSAEMRDARSRRAYLEKVADIGAAGIKIDFIPACTAEITRWYEGALKDTAELKLLCNFHGSVKFTGRQRTWPHELTREAVRGHEYHMSRYGRVQAADHDTIVPFTRYLCGPADYTPTAFDQKEMMGYTWTHLLAPGGGYDLAAVALCREISGLHRQPGRRSDSPSACNVGMKRLCCRAAKSVRWSVSRAGKAMPGSSGCSTALKPPHFPSTCRSWGSGKWNAKIFADDPDNPATFRQAEKSVTARDQIEAPMSPRGGFVCWITK